MDNRGELLWEYRKNHIAKSLGEFLALSFKVWIMKFALSGMMLIVLQLSGFDKLFSYGIIFLTALVSYVVLKEYFFRAWVTKSILYSVYSKGIGFSWGEMDDQNLFVYFRDIKSISPVKLNSENIDTIYFQTYDTKLYNAFPFLSDGNQNQVCFSLIERGQEAMNAISHNFSNESSSERQLNVENPFWLRLEPRYLINFNLFFAFLFILYGTYQIVRFVDYHMLSNHKVVDKVISQVQLDNGEDLLGSKIVTTSGYTFVSGISGDRVGQYLEFYASPIFNNVNQLFVEGSEITEVIKSELIGLFGGARVLLLIIIFISTFYIMYKRGRVPFEDLTFAILLPFLLTLFVNFVFSY